MVVNYPALEVILSAFLTCSVVEGCSKSLPIAALYINCYVVSRLESESYSCTKVERMRIRCVRIICNCRLYNLLYLYLFIIFYGGRMDGWVGKRVNVRVINYLTIFYQLYLNFIGTVYLKGMGRKRCSSLSRSPVITWRDYGTGRKPGNNRCPDRISTRYDKNTSQKYSCLNQLTRCTYSVPNAGIPVVL